MGEGVVRRRAPQIRIKNKLPDVENALTINTLGNIKNAIKEPWSALNGSAAPLGRKLPTSAHKNLQSLATTPLTR
jgi:hypothetical protein